MRGRERILNLSNLSEKERGYLFGLFEGDGYKMHDKKGRHYTIEFYLNSIKDKKIIHFLLSLLKKVSVNPSIYQDKRFNCKRIRFYSKSLFNLFNKNIFIEKENYEFKLGFVSGIIDSEGYVNDKKYMIMVTNTNQRILEDCKDFLSSINIYSSISRRKKGIKDKLPSFIMYISVNFKRLNHLSIKAGKRFP